MPFRGPLVGARYGDSGHLTKMGMPIGLQITSNHLAEMTAISVARAYERATEWHTRRPRCCNA